MGCAIFHGCYIKVLFLRKTNRADTLVRTFRDYLKMHGDLEKISGYVVLITKYDKRNLSKYVINCIIKAELITERLILHRKKFFLNIGFMLPLIKIIIIIKVVGVGICKFCEYCGLLKIAVKVVRENALDLSNFLTLWVCAISILILVIGKTSEVNYGFKLGTLLVYKIPVQWFCILSIIYACLLPAGFIFERLQYKCLFFLTFVVNYIYMLMVVFSVMWFSRKEVILNIIIERSVSMVQKDRRLLDATKLPLMNLIHNIDLDINLEKSKLMEGIIKLCQIIDEEDTLIRYVLMMGLVNEIVKRSGLEKRYEQRRTIDFLRELLDNVERKFSDMDYEEKRCNSLALSAGIILPLVSWSAEIKDSKIYEQLILSKEEKEKDQLIILMGMYMEYFASCGDTDDSRIDLLTKLNMADILQSKTFIEDKDFWDIMSVFWFSWEMMNEQSFYMYWNYENFRDGCIRWKKAKKELFFQETSYVLRELREGVFYEWHGFADFI